MLIPICNNRSIPTLLCMPGGLSRLFSMRRLLAVNGTFLKARFVQTLLLSVSIDANGQITLLAWGVVESENRNSWE
jgi:hypothetical protein